MAYGRAEEAKCVKCSRTLPVFCVGKGQIYRDTVVKRISPLHENKPDAVPVWLCGRCVTEISLDLSY